MQDYQIVRQAIYIQAPLETVWQHLTRPDQQEEWYVAPCLTMGWDEGDRVAWGLPQAPVIEGHLLTWQPAATFSYTFRFTRFDEPESWVRWQVQLLGEVVYVEVAHHFPQEALETQAIVTDGWTTVLSRLKTLLETGHAMPWPEYEEGEEV